MVAKVNSSLDSRILAPSTGRQFLKVGATRSRTKVSASSLAAMTHIAGPGSSETHQQARLRKVCVLEDCAEHLMAMSLTRLSATASIGSLTQGELSERQRPGMGDVLSTTICDSHHCQGVRPSAGRVAALN